MTISHLKVMIFFEHIYTYIALLNRYLSQRAKTDYHPVSKSEIPGKNVKPDKNQKPKPTRLVPTDI